MLALIIAILIFLFLWVIYWRFIHFRFFKSKENKKKLLELEYKRLNEYALHLEIIGFGFLVSGLAIIDKGTIALISILFGFVIILVSLIHDGRAEVRYRRLKELI